MVVNERRTDGAAPTPTGPVGRAGPSAGPIPLTLVTGGGPAAREEALAVWLARRQESGGNPPAVIVEGLPDGRGLLEATGAAVSRIAAGCICCGGNLVLRVTLDRALRRRPPALWIVPATDMHLERIREFLCAPPYSGLLVLGEDLRIGIAV